jgi:hypothetical protein
MVRSIYSWSAGAGLLFYGLLEDGWNDRMGSNMPASKQDEKREFIGPKRDPGKTDENGEIVSGPVSRFRPFPFLSRRYENGQV